MLRFTFSKQVDMACVEDTLVLAVLAAESIHGRTDIRLDACFRLQPGTCSIDDGTPVGRTIARVFTGYLAREFGEGAFTIVRVAAGNTESEAA
ncbi:hypothetical protein [Solidesulfovibrio sp.]|uniref:hypothetical protein n=1 Tax=Solidesulfovibrio sp. TaxID=2910990 RepID=UPI002B218A49|nr:hypothetical protein [Solidesulfovibrio sp.]MEA5087809.1 hypothetical protein [Solidesulfovibrio sp.]